MSPRRNGMVFAALGVAVFAVSWAAILIRVAAAPPLAIAFWRLAFATLFLLPVAGWAGRRQAAAGGPAPQTPASKALVWAAGTLLALHFALWIASLFMTSVASSVILVATQPIFAGLLAGPLLGERPPARTWIAIALALGGTAVIGGGDLLVSRRALQGDLLALAAAAAAAAYLILGRRARQGGPLPIYLVRVNMAAAAVLLAACLWQSTPLTGYPAATWIVFGGLAVGPHLAGHGLLNLAVRHLPAPTVNLALVGEPLLSSFYAALIFAEIPSRWFYAGSVLVLGALLVEVSGMRGGGVRSVEAE